ncbi:MAG: hypothetical protein HQL95_03930 [Magnetococcales bacterium]|nr:hypothetical protein [Magnetococcales bacterium]
MKGGHIEWRLLTRTLVVICLSLVLDVGMIGAGWYYLDDADITLEKLRKSIAALRTQRREHEEQARMLAQVQPGFEELRLKGVVGPEQRLQWVEAVKEIGELLKLPVGLRFKLDPSRPFTPAVSLPVSQDYQLVASHMELQLGMVHEGDLISLLDHLQGRKPGLFHVIGCKLTPLTDFTQDDKGVKAGVNLQGVCQMEWFNFREMENKGR